MFSLGKAAVKAEKASNPSLFLTNKKVTDRSKLSAKITTEGTAAILVYKVYIYIFDSITRNRFTTICTKTDLNFYIKSEFTNLQIKLRIF